MKQFKNIQVDFDQSIATVWLNRPQVHNALNGDMLNEIIDCFRNLNSSDETRCIVLRGKGESFCSGADLAWMHQSAHSDYSITNNNSLLLASCFKTIHDSVKPVVAFVHGAAYAGGVGLMSACDLAIATEHATFSIPETRIGLVPSTILPYVLTRINQHKAKALIYTGQKIKASIAFDIGLVDFLFNEAEAEEGIKKLLNDILKASPNSLTEIKNLLHACTGKPIDDVMVKMTISTLSRVKLSEEGKEGLAAFAEKREPKWIKEIK